VSIFVPGFCPTAKIPKKPLNFANGYAIMPEEAAGRCRERVSEGRAEKD